MDKLERILESVRDHSQQALEFRSTPLSNAYLKQLCDALAADNAVGFLTIQNCQLRDDGAVMLGDMLKLNDRIKTLSVRANALSDSGALTIAQSINPSVTELNLQENPLSEDGIQPIAAALKGNKSLYYVRLDAPCEAIDALCADNRHRAAALTQKIKSGVQRELADYQEAWERRHSIARYDTGTAAFIARMPESFAQTHVDSTLTPDGLTLDSPFTWHQFNEIVAQLETNGTPLLPEHLEQYSPRWDMSYLECGLTCAPEQVIPFLNRHGIQLRQDFFLDEDGKPNARLQDFADRQKIQSLFTKENWQGAGAHEMKAFHSKLTEAAKGQLRNTHALFAALQSNPQSRQL